MPPVDVRPIATADLAEVASVHRAAFPESALSRLGDSVVRRFYEWQLRGPHDYDAFGAWMDDELVGICLGGVGRGALSGFVEKNWHFLTASVLIRPWLLFLPTFRDRLNLGVTSFFRRVRSRGKTEVGNRVRRKKRSFGILVIAVRPDRQARGIGRKLMNAAEAAARRRNFEAMHLTVHPENRRAVCFYETSGWKRDDDGNWTGRMHKALP